MENPSGKDGYMVVRVTGGNCEFDSFHDKVWLANSRADEMCKAITEDAIPASGAVYVLAAVQHTQPIAP